MSEPSNPSTKPVAAAPARILVVDDQPANIQVVGTVLGKLGHEIIPASDGPTALQRLELRPPDLILLDLMMPHMDGLEVCRRLREIAVAKDIPVIFLSAADDKDFIVRALEAGGVDYITKPFNHAELVSRVRTQLALKSARDRLQQLAEDKDELLGILAHDLKNHLGGMEMSAGLLQDRLTRAEDSRSALLAENILRSNKQLLSFVKEFLANAHADHSFTVKLVPLDLSAAAAAAVQQYQEAAQRKNLEIVNGSSGEAFTVLADPTALRQVIDNLLSNALKFSSPGQKIEVTIRGSPTQVECSVQDHGPGFSEADRPKMFRRYGRLSARPTGGEPSTGLGLSIVRKLVLLMNGEINCDSTPGAGATFTVRLPRAT
jgi:two-component system, sensor histidine kinase and response regulator